MSIVIISIISRATFVNFITFYRFAEIAGPFKIEEFELNVLSPEFLSDDWKLLFSIFNYLKGNEINCNNNSQSTNPIDFLQEFSVETNNELFQDNYESSYLTIHEHFNDSLDSLDSGI